MPKFIDRTLPLIPGAGSEQEMWRKSAHLARYLACMVGLTVTYFEVTPAQLSVLQTLPEAAEARFLLRVSSTSERQASPPAAGYITSAAGLSAAVVEVTLESLGDLATFGELVSDTERLRELGRTKRPAYRITGLDDLLLTDYTAAFKRLRRRFGRYVDLCPRDGLGLASGIAVEWVLSGGEWVTVTLFSHGGYAAFEQVLMALHLASRYKPTLDMRGLAELKTVYTALTGLALPPDQPVVGENLFVAEAGIHVDGILKAANIYEPYPPELVGLSRKFTIGKHSGAAAVADALCRLGLEADSRAVDCILCRCRARSLELGRSLTDEEFAELAESCTGEGGVESCERVHLSCGYHTA